MDFDESLARAEAALARRQKVDQDAAEALHRIRAYHGSLGTALLSSLASWVARSIVIAYWCEDRRNGVPDKELMEDAARSAQRWLDGEARWARLRQRAQKGRHGDRLNSARHAVLAPIESELQRASDAAETTGVPYARDLWCDVARARIGIRRQRPVPWNRTQAIVRQFATVVQHPPARILTANESNEWLLLIRATLSDDAGDDLLSGALASLEQGAGLSDRVGVPWERLGFVGPMTPRRLLPLCVDTDSALDRRHRHSLPAPPEVLQAERLENELRIDERLIRMANLALAHLPHVVLPRPAVSARWTLPFDSQSPPPASERRDRFLAAAYEVMMRGDSKRVTNRGVHEACYLETLEGRSEKKWIRDQALEEKKEGGALVEHADGGYTLSETALKEACQIHKRRWPNEAG